MATRKPTGDVLEAIRELGRQGGKKRAKNLSDERRKEIAKQAAAARWKDHPKKHR